MAAPSSSRTYYDVLHVSRDAPRAIIQGSYRTLMQKLKHHPDLGGGAANASMINKAYAVLNDPEKRAAYDAQLDILSHVGAAFSGASPAVSGEASETDSGIHGSACLFCNAPHQLGSVITVEAVCESCGSPLRAAEATRIESKGQRAVARLKKNQQIEILADWPFQRTYHSKTRDISLSGLSFETSLDLQEGQRLKVTSSVLEAVAVVTHCSAPQGFWNAKRIVGVSFLTLRFVSPRGGFVSEQV